MNLSSIHSEIEIHKAYIKPGMTVFYSDMSWTMRYEVIAVDEQSMTVKDTDGYQETHDFATLQHGWVLSSKDKEIISLCKQAINATELKKNVEALASQEEMTELETISLLQTGAAATDNSELLDALCDLKWDYIS